MHTWAWMWTGNFLLEHCGTGRASFLKAPCGQSENPPANLDCLPIKVKLRPVDKGWDTSSFSEAVICCVYNVKVDMLLIPVRLCWDQFSLTINVD